MKDLTRVLREGICIALPSSILITANSRKSRLDAGGASATMAWMTAATKGEDGGDLGRGPRRPWGGRGPRRPCRGQRPGTKTAAAPMRTRTAALDVERSGEVDVLPRA